MFFRRYDRIIVAICLFLLWSFAGIEARNCSKILELAAQYSEVLAREIRVKRQIPTRDDLARKLKINPRELKGDLNINALLKLAKQNHEAVFEELHQIMVKAMSKFFKLHMRLPNRTELADLLGINVKQLPQIFEIPEDGLAEIRDFDARSLNVVRSRMARVYAKWAKERGTPPTIKDLALVLEMDAKDLEFLFGNGRLFENLSDLKALAIKENRKAFTHFHDSDIFTKEHEVAMLKAWKESTTAIVTTAVAGVAVHSKAFERLQRIAEARGAPIFVLPQNMQTFGLDAMLLNAPNVHIVTNPVILGDFLSVNSRGGKMAKMINPTRGLQRIGPRGQSQVIPSPKFFLKVVPTTHAINSESPHKIISTGAITVADYNGPLAIQARTDEIAQHDHRIGALLLERANAGNGRYHMRHIEYVPERDGFFDMNEFFGADGVKRERPLAMILGDLHPGETDPRLLETLPDLLNEVQPHFIVGHDIFDGRAVNHHDSDKVITTAINAQRGFLDIPGELRIAADMINWILSLRDDFTFVVAPANHDFRLQKWLDSGDFMKHPEARAFGLKLAQFSLENGGDPVLLLKHGLELMGLEQTDRIRFLAVGESFTVGPKNRKVELGLHGHAGANGKKGSLQVFRAGMDGSVTAHSHTIERENDAVRVGTFTPPVVGYTKDGLSNWVQALGIVGPNGEKQILEFIKGEWHGRNNDPRKNFFDPSYPHIVHPPSSSGAGQIDQYRPVD